MANEIQKCTACGAELDYLPDMACGCGATLTSCFECEDGRRQRRQFLIDHERHPDPE